jgi:hypothetical protein
LQYDKKASLWAADSAFAPAAPPRRLSARGKPSGGAGQAFEARRCIQFGQYAKPNPAALPDM